MDILRSSYHAKPNDVKTFLASWRLELVQRDHIVKWNLNVVSLVPKPYLLAIAICRNLDTFPMVTLQFHQQQSQRKTLFENMARSKRETKPVEWFEGEIHVLSSRSTPRNPVSTSERTSITTLKSKTSKSVTKKKINLRASTIITETSEGICVLLVHYC